MITHLDLFAFFLDFFLFGFFFGGGESYGEEGSSSSILVPKASICTCKLISNVFHGSIVDGRYIW